MLIELRTPDIPRSAGIRQQFTDRHLCCKLLVRIAGQILCQWIVESQLSRLHKLHCRYTGNHLVHGRNGKARLQRIGDVMFPVRLTIGFREDRLALPRDHHGPGKPACSRFLQKPLAQRGDQVALAHGR